MKTPRCALVALISVFILGSAAPGRAQTDYVVGPQDVLTITVFGEADLSGRYTVELDGSFTYPLVGRVMAGGLTLRALEQEIRTQLADGFLTNPQVTVAIEQYRSQRIVVIGEVRAPGEYQLSGDMTLLAGIAKAGSTTPAASREVQITRPARKPSVPEGSNRTPQAEIIRIDLDALQAGNLSLNIALQDGDTIYVPKALLVFVSGHVKSTGAYPVEKGMTVLQALALAGGETERGSTGRIRIQRTVSGKKIEFKASLNDVVEPGDTIYVGERFF